jgi:hypothetical protein
MNGAYDILSGVPDNGPIWIETIHGLENARTRLTNLNHMKPGEYFVFDSYAAKIVHTTSEAVQMTQPHSRDLWPSHRPNFFRYLQSAHYKKYQQD